MDLSTYLPPFNTTTLIKPMNEEEEETLWRTPVSVKTILPGRGTLSILKKKKKFKKTEGLHNVRRSRIPTTSDIYLYI
jgi:hypothetical protein